MSKKAKIEIRTGAPTAAEFKDAKAAADAAQQRLLPPFSRRKKMQTRLAQLPYPPFWVDPSPRPKPG